MNRRSFLSWLGLTVISVAVGMKSYDHYFHEKESKLATNLKPLFDPSFKEAAEIMEASIIFAKLKNKGVILENSSVSASTVIKLAKTEQILEYNGRYYSQTELELYSIAYLIHEREIDFEGI